MEAVSFVQVACFPAAAQDSNRAQFFQRERPSRANVSIGLVGKGTSFRVFDEEQTAGYLRMIEGEEKRSGSGEAQPEEAPQPPPADEGPQDPTPNVVDVTSYDLFGVCSVAIHSLPECVGGEADVLFVTVLAL
ncbi:hypothetical protein PR048_030159 [Dryococelus australis]|uniref:Uncharacterized protein n=1 Tax=Dryococelus australis TaxID=614101 RepID=A0ABQ9G863_9NEOP|nr:hypothetical protein PR048_030159 [Dryococelus australis]